MVDWSRMEEEWEWEGPVRVRFDVVWAPPKVQTPA